MINSRTNAIAGWARQARPNRRAMGKALGGAAVGMLVASRWGAATGQGAAKGVRDHPAIIALTAVLQDAAAALGTPVTDIAVQRLEAEDWPDACLGLAGPDEGCAEVITPGFRVVLAASSGGQTVYRTDQRGNFRREPATANQDALRVHFERTGGIAGRHDEIDLDTAGLPETDASELRRLLAEADFWNLPVELAEEVTVADGYQYRVTVTQGTRSHTVSGYGIASLDQTQNPGFWRLASWLEQHIGTGS